ncbi:phosphate ABC transporter permease PstA [Candidatus Poseidoniales archaeon]|nr:phosphate ABC transporter permease PstA [Candidatus Poseidoniales archaeon]MDA8801709.1 phosphate ABC transporter permease PstA [Candidatus Poseidoniales archaeon]|tara:strand:+ start:3870 stop:5585 length:1716 start_codon:yes stop_codon:yes gene_type:complete
MKDIDKLQKRNRKLRDLTERAGSTGLAITGLIGLLFLGVLVWQIAEPTFIKGEQGEITPASEWIPESDYRFKWDFPTVDENGEPFTDPVVLRFEWDDENGSHSHDVEINVIDTRQVKTDIYIDSTGVDQTEIDVGRKTNFNAYSSLGVPVSVEQISGPVPNADETGYPAVNTFVITGDVHILLDDENEQVFQPMELLAWITLLILIIVLTWPNVAALKIIQKLKGRRTLIKLASYVLAGTTFAISDGMFVAAALGSICWLVSGVILYKIAEGIERLENLGRELSETSRLKHSISARDGVLMWSRMLLFTSTLFIPLLIDIPFLTERYQDIFIPYASGIRAAFYGTIWVMLIAMLVSIPVSVGAAIYLEEYAKPNRTTKLIQALVTNLAGVPSIVFGMFGLAIFVKQDGFGWGLGPSVLAAGLTMGVMAMPIIVLAGQEALRSVPRSLRESAYGIGCTRWQVTKDHVLPSAMPGIMTGTILAMSRIMGEAAPLVVIGATAMILFDPEPLAALNGGNVNFTVIPIQIYFWTAEPDHAWHSMAAAASIALICLLVAMNSIAIVLRQHFRKRLKS